MAMQKNLKTFKLGPVGKTQEDLPSVIETLANFLLSRGTFSNGHTKISARNNCAGRLNIITIFHLSKKQLLQLASSHEGLSNMQIWWNARHLPPCPLPSAAYKLQTLSRKSSSQIGDRNQGRPCRDIFNLFAGCSHKIYTFWMKSDFRFPAIGHRNLSTSEDFQTQASQKS